MTDPAITRRRVLKATGGALALGVLGTRTAFAQEACEGATLESTPADYPELDLREESPAASNIPDDSEVVVYVHGYSTPASYGRRLATTFERALSENDYDQPVIATLWRSLPEEEAEGTQGAAENFATAESNADADATKLASWLEANLADRTIRLVGYSLGTRVVLQALTELDSVAVESVSLLGAAVPAVELCQDGAYDLSAAERVFAYSSTNDQVICDSYGGYLSVFADAEPPPLGCDGLACDGNTPGNLAARDVSGTISNHCAYGFPEVGVVSQVVEDFDIDPADVTQETPAPTATPEPTATSTPEPTATATPEPTATETPAPTETATETPSDGNGAGFGIASTILGGTALGALARRRLGDDEQ